MTMNQMLMSAESFGTTTKSVDVSPRRVVTTATDKNVVFCSIHVELPPRKSISTFSSFLAELSEEDQLFDSDMKEARQWVADKYYAGENSLRKMRLSRGWSQSYLAEKLQTSQAQVAKLELRKTDPQLTTIKKLAAAFDISVGDMASVLAEEIV